MSSGPQLVRENALFTHLHVHSEYSMLDGFSNIKSMVKSASEQGMKALAITDHGSMYGVVDFYTACLEFGIKPIIGCELYVAPQSHTGRQPSDKHPYHLTVLAENETGYHNLVKLVTKANLDGFYYKPRVDKHLLEEHSEGLVVLSGCPSAELSQLITNGNLEEGKDLVRWYTSTFQHFYLELQRHGNLPVLDTLNPGLLRIADELGVPIIATNDLHYVRKEDAPYQDVMVCIQTNTTINDQKRLQMSDDSYYLKSPAEMEELFRDFPEAIANTEQVADACNVTLDFSQLHLPEFPVPDGIDPDSYLRKLCWQGFEQRFGSDPPAAAIQRLDYELDVVTKTQYPTYFLVVWEIANFARDNNILFGVRGSAASSLALYCLNVTDIDPLEYGLVFERFLNIERKEMPDIDLDFQDDKREEAIRHVVNKYGPDHVAQIITFGTLGAKAAIRDVGRALALPYSDVDRIARMIPTKVGMTIATAYQESPELREAYQTVETYQNLIDTAAKLEGTVRNTSTHAAGVVISQSPLSEHVPLQRPVKTDDQNAIMTQYAMEPIAKLGLLKMDFLGLANLTILSMAQNLIKENHNTTIDFPKIPLDDPSTFQLLESGETTGLFQLESTGMRRYIKELKPTSLGDLAAMIALYRPGPMDHIGSFIEAKHGRREAKSPHPALEDILHETYGIIVYQDQVLHILRTFAGYSLGGADIVRKAMGKKIPELMAQERDQFITGAINQGFEGALAEELFQLIEPFAGYAFNKAHSVSYALIAYWTAYLKANYCVEFMTSVMNAYKGNADKVALVAEECARLGIPLLPPDLNNSQVNFSVEVDPEGKSSVRFGLSGIKNVGAAAISSLVNERNQNGTFSSLDDFCRRAGPHLANRRTIESIIRVGALDVFGGRGSLLETIDLIMNFAQKETQRKLSGQTTMFDMLGDSNDDSLGQIQLKDAIEPSLIEKSQWERQLLGISVTGGTLQHIALTAPANAILSREDLDNEATNSKVFVIGTVSSVRRPYDKEQRPIAFVNLELLGGSIEIAVWSNVYPSTVSLWEDGAIVQVQGAVTRRGDSLGLRCDQAQRYQLPQETPHNEPEPVPGPRFEKWEGNWSGQEASPNATGSNNLVINGREPLPTENYPHLNGNANTNGSSPGTLAHGRNGTNGSGPQSKKILINLSETDKPEQDASLLRQVLVVLLNYPGNDKVDLLILSQGTKYRLEMPIITTTFCPELAGQINELLGSSDAIRVQTDAVI